MRLHRASFAFAHALLAGLLVAACADSDDGANALDAAIGTSSSTGAQRDAMNPGTVGAPSGGDAAVTAGPGSAVVMDAATNVRDAASSVRDSGVPARDASAAVEDGRVRTYPDAAIDAAMAEGDAGGGVASTCTQADVNSCSNQTGSHCGYTYEYWKDQGTGCLTNTRTGFKVEWSNINNLLGRKGLRPGSKTQVVSYSADYQPNGNSYLCVYGWTKSPLVEYYIVDSWGSWRPPGGEGHMGTVNSDDGTYDIYRTQRVNQPSIEGTTTFYQYWSVRTQKRSSGTITVANHFNMWQQLGLNMGNLYEVSMTVEGYQSSGTATVDFSMR
jgi:endo-1,4-beta-xylanase